MNTQSVQVSQGVRRLSKRNARRFRQAAARRRLQELQDEKVLQSWLTEVWDEPALLIENDPSSNFDYRSLS